MAHSSPAPPTQKLPSQLETGHLLCKKQRRFSSHDHGTKCRACPPPLLPNCRHFNASQLPACCCNSTVLAGGNCSPVPPHAALRRSWPNRVAAMLLDSRPPRRHAVGGKTAAPARSQASILLGAGRCLMGPAVDRALASEHGLGDSEMSFSHLTNPRNRAPPQREQAKWRMAMIVGDWNFGRLIQVTDQVCRLESRPRPRTWICGLPLWVFRLRLNSNPTLDVNPNRLLAHGAPPDEMAGANQRRLHQTNSHPSPAK